MLNVQKILKASLAIVLLGVQGVSVAGIAEFNAAVKKGDYKTAAAETIGIWEKFDKTVPHTATIAREFGFVNYMAQDYKNAERFARFLVERGSALSKPDDQPFISSVLFYLARFADNKSQETANDLQNALKERQSLAGIDNISIIAVESLYKYSWVNGDWASAKTNSDIAIDIYSRAREAYAGKLREAQFVNVVANFLEEPSEADLAAMIKLQEELTSDSKLSAGENDNELINYINWQLLAWVFTADRYFFYNNIVTNKEASLIAVSLDESNQQACKADIDLGDLAYPEEWKGSNTMGTVVASLKFNEGGRLDSHKILGEAPPNMFSTAVNKSARTFRISSSPSLQTEPCVSPPIEIIKVISFFPGCVELYGAGTCKSLDKIINRHYINVEESPRMFNEAGTNQIPRPPMR